MIGAALMPEPALNCHSSLPVLASSALNQPDVAVERQAARGRQGAAEVRQVVLVAPHLLLLHRIPGHQLAHVAARAGLAELELEREVELAALVVGVDALQSMQRLFVGM